MTDAEVNEAIEATESFMDDLVESMTAEQAKEFYENIGYHANTMASTV